MVVNSLCVLFASYISSSVPEKLATQKCQWAKIQPWASGEQVGSLDLHSCPAAKGTPPSWSMEGPGGTQGGAPWTSASLCQ